jgi:class 3 adenylate cyclase/tetratricopeptide (TPR) repeat protein
MSNKNHKLAAIVFTDIVGYTKRMEENELHTMQLLQKQREIVFPIVKAHGGEVVKEIGDGLLIMFQSAIEAVRFATETQLRLKDEDLTIRAGIHIGDVIFKDGDVFGSAVNTAARIEPLAQPNGICISEDVRNQVRNKDDIKTYSCGKKVLKGVNESIEIFEVHLEGITEKEKTTPTNLLKELWNRRVIQISAIYLISAYIIKMAVSSFITGQMLSPHITQLIWIILLSLLPSVFLIAFFHGKKEAGKWTKVEIAGLPVNAILTILLIVFLFKGKDLGATTTTVTVEDEDGKKTERTVLKSEFRKKIALFFFDNESSNTEYNWLQYSIPTLIEYDLLQDIYVRIKSANNIIPKLKEAGFNDGTKIPLMLKKKISEHYHLNYFLSGSFDIKDRKYIIRTKLFDTEKAKLISETTFSGADLFQLIDQISVQLKQDVNIPQNHIEDIKDLSIAEIFTSSEKALEYYSKGLYEVTFNNDYQQGTELLNKAVDIDHEFAIAQLILAELYFNQSKIEKAKVALQSTRDNLYNLPERYQFLTKFFHYIINEEADKANAVIKMAVELFPEDLELHSMLAARYQMDNKIAEAISEYKLILKLDPELFDYLIMLGNIYEKSGKPDSALYYYKLYAEQFPKDYKSYQNIGKYYLKIAEFDKAHEYYEKAIFLESENVSLSVKLADIDLRTGNFEEAFSEYNKTLKISKTPRDSSKVYSAISSFYRLKGQNIKALEYLKKDYDLKEKFEAPIQVLASYAFSTEVYFNAGKENEIYSILKDIQKLEPPLNKVASFGYLFAYIELKDTTDKVEQMIADAEELAVGFGQKDLLAGVYYGKGRINEIKGEYKKAIENYEKYFEIQPTSYSKYRFVSRAYRKLNQYKTAEEYILKVLKYYPYSPNANYEAALLYFDMDDTKKAIEHLKKANEIWKDADENYEPAINAKTKLLELESI